MIDAKLSSRERLIQAISDPNLGFILLIVGVLGVYVELSSPGLIFPGVGGAVLVLLGLSSLSLLPINWTGAALIILAIALFVLEAKFTSHGILGIGGAVAMALGSVILLNGPPEGRIHWSPALCVTLPFTLIAIFLIPVFVRTLLGTDLPGLGFNVEYRRFDDGVWFPVSFGTEFRLRAVFFINRDITVSL